MMLMFLLLGMKVQTNLNKDTRDEQENKVVFYAGIAHFLRSHYIILYLPDQIDQ